MCNRYTLAAVIPATMRRVSARHLSGSDEMLVANRCVELGGFSLILKHDGEAKRRNYSLCGGLIGSEATAVS